jgi:TolB-like protein/lipoprotein NlpI
MSIWSIEIKQIENLYESLKGQLPDLEKELGQLIKSGDANVILLYSRRCLEVIITDLCECELKRPRKTEPLKGIIDKLHKEEKVPSNIITSMDHLNSLSAYGAHPKDFDPEQVKPVLINLDIIIKWYLRYRDLQIISKIESIETKYENKQQTVSPREKSIIVLPFENISPDPDQEYFSDGLTEEIISDLSNIRDLLVISRSSAMTFKGTNKKIGEIAKEVNVRYVLEGSVRKAGNNLRITAQLIDGINDSHIWAEKYSGTLDDVFDIQEKVSLSIVNALKLKLISGEVDKESAQDQWVSEKKTAINLDAYNLYLRGRYFSNQHTENGFKKSLEYFARAIKTEKEYALAYVGLARCYEELTRLSFIPFNKGYLNAKKAVTKALGLDNKLGEAYAMLGSLKMTMEWDVLSPESDYEHALELNPGSIEIYKMYIQYLTWVGKFDKGIVLARKALELDPLTPFTIFNLGFILFFAGKYDESINHLNDTLNLDSSFVWAYMYLSYNYVMKGMYDKAIIYADNSISFWQTEHKAIPYGFMGWVYSKSGRPDKAQKLLSLLKMINKEGSLDPYCMAIIYSGLNMNDKVFEWLQKAFDFHSGLLLYLKIHSQCFFKELSADPRYYELLERVGFLTDEN